MWRHAIFLAGALLITDATGAPALFAQQNIPEVARPLLEEAERHRDAGRIAEAIRRYGDVLRLAPDLVSIYVSLGALYTQQDRLEEALEVFRGGLERAPTDGLLLYNAAAVELQRGRPAEALSYLDRAVARPSTDASLQVLRGTALRRLDRPAEALEAFRAAVRLDPKDARSHLNLGNIYHQLGRARDALQAYREAIRHDSNLIAAHYNLGAVLFELGQYDEALKAYEIGLAPIEKDLGEGRAVDTVHARAYLNLGAIYLRKQDGPRALQAYQKAARLDPGQAPAHYSSGYLLYQEGRLEEAYEAYQHALALDRALPFAYLHLGLIDFRRDRLESATRWLTEGLPQLVGEARTEALLTLAETARRGGDRGAARQRYRQVLETDGRSVRALVALGAVLREDGQLDEARGLLARAHDLAPANEAALLELAGVAKAGGNRSAEMAAYREILDRAGDRDDLWPVRVRMVNLLVEEGAVREAIPAMEGLIRRLTTRPGDDVAASTLLPPPEMRKVLRTAYGILLVTDGRHSDAVPEFEAALDDDPTYGAARTALAVLGALGGKLGEAEMVLRGVLARAETEAVRGLGAADLGQALWLLGRLDEAAPYLRTAADRFPDHASLQTALGEIALKDGEYAEATARLARATDLCAGRSDRSTKPNSQAGGVSERQLMQVIVGGPPGGSDALCNRARRVLGRVLVNAASQRLGAADIQARELLERALTLPLDASTRAHAFLLRGTLNLRGDRIEVARQDLQRALAGELAAELRAVARNNLGLVFYRQGALGDARREFEAARAGSAPPIESTLNLGITLHESEPRRALALYEEYVALGGTRRDEVRQWIDDLRRVYR